jgi:hypothetical protein
LPPLAAWKWRPKEKKERSMDLELLILEQLKYTCVQQRNKQTHSPMRLEEREIGEVMKSYDPNPLSSKGQLKIPIW